MVDFKYKVTDIAKDFGISTKKVIETFAELTGETRKTGATFEENEVNALLEALTAKPPSRTWASIWHPARNRSRQAGDQKPEAKPQAKKKRRSRRPLSPSPSSPSSRKPPRQSRKRSRPSPPRMRSPRQHSPNRPSRKSAMISAMITSRPKSAAKSV